MMVAGGCSALAFRARVEYALIYEAGTELSDADDPP
jgi:hypothetical protein